VPICGPLERDPESAATVVNPTVVFEVLSDGTESYDRDEKLSHYRRIPSLQACILVSHRQQLLERWTRAADTSGAPAGPAVPPSSAPGGPADTPNKAPDDWTRTEARAGDTLVIPVLGCALDVSELYAVLGDDIPPR
jgi:hypothetical protein